MAEAAVLYDYGLEYKKGGVVDRGWNSWAADHLEELDTLRTGFIGNLSATADEHYILFHIAEYLKTLDGVVQVDYTPEQETNTMWVAGTEKQVEITVDEFLTKVP
jgi:hypothetical protein